jgi:hypothetical protein
MIISSLSMTALLILSHKGYIRLGWSWLIVLGTIETLVLGFVFSFIKQLIAVPATAKHLSD